MNKVSALGRIIEHHKVVQGLGYNTFGTFLQGSQNYGFEYEGSDVDSKSLVIPSFSDLCLSKPKTSFTHVHENNEHTDIKDVRVMVQCWLKQNVNMVEILFTNFCMINPKYVDQYEILFHIRHEISRYDEVAGLKCCQGMALEKYKAMKHPYPSIIDKIEKYGYDCYTSDTLFLTQSGWKTYDEIREDDMLATMCQQTHRLEFQKYTSRVKKPAYEVFTVETTSTKFSITTNHNIFTSPICNINKNGHKYNGGSWNLGPLIDELNGNFHRHLINFPINENVDYPVTDEDLLLIGAFVSEGTINFRDKEQNEVKTARIVQTSNGKSDFYEMMSKIPGLNRWDSDKETIWATTKQKAEWLMNLCGHGSKIKRLPDFYTQLSRRQAEVLLNSLMLGDGSFSPVRDTYYTSSYKLANDVLALALLSGRQAVMLGGKSGYKSRGNFGEVMMYHVQIKHKALAPTYVYLKEGENVERSEYSGDVVCFEVPNGLLVTQQDGKTAVQGNCKQLHHIVRLEKFIKYFYMEGLDYEDAQRKVRENHYHELMDIKLGFVGLNTAEIYAKVSLETIDVYRKMFNNAPNIDLQDYVSNRLDKFVVSLFQEGIA